MPRTSRLRTAPLAVAALLLAGVVAAQPGLPQPPQLAPIPLNEAEEKKEP